jgi:hypothetical protein
LLRCQVAFWEIDIKTPGSPQKGKSDVQARLESAADSGLKRASSTDDSGERLAKAEANRKVGLKPHPLRGKESE